MRAGRSGSSLIEKMPRCVRGTSPKWIVCSSPRYRPSATRMGSTSPIRSATDASGVASFSEKRRSRPIHSIGVSSPFSATSARQRAQIGESGESLTSHPATIGICVVEQLDELADQPRLRLPALAQDDHVVSGEDRAFQTRQHGVVVADDPGDERLVRAQSRDEVLTELVLDGLVAPAGSDELSEGLRWSGKHVGYATRPCRPSTGTDWSSPTRISAALAKEPSSSFTACCSRRT